MSTKGRTGPRPFADAWKHEKKLPLVHRVFIMLNILPPSSEEVHKPEPNEKVLVYRELNQLIFPFPLALLPFILRYFYYHYVSHEMPGAFVTWFFLFLHTLTVGMLSVRHFNLHLRIHGYLDSEAGRDTVPFELMPKVAFEVIGAVMLRPALIVLATYDPKEEPRLTWWLPVQMFLLTLTEDFTYYWLHRLCHEADSCWHFHRLHHTTKHPTTMLLGYADDFQEFIDFIGSPMISWLMCPFGFDVTVTWMIMLNYVQLAGHTGLRLHAGPFGLDLVVEDHDLHHRHGWKDSYNYGKQTRFWDSLYGTTGDRIEGRPDNLDWSKFIKLDYK
ncbi:hypothetical protein MVES1_000791 [Malassezia vespertilionis]|uniref:uncharacterized protein n=1 Tax=Malassezia vespertilionis TaxID=2020962 RepID=UPI0024B1CE78|nr:uncharacterized protein MVES1_000791 [Malassezia vespertilionis]WFD05461.1 hypothetical protein MVES1_000791 [Malassezia vespertilionis]